MSHAFDAASAAPDAKQAEPRKPGMLGAVEAALGLINRAIMVLGGVALVVACLVLSYSVAVRYVLRIPTDWQDETAVFLIIGATFFSAAAVQARRGHVSIEALTGLLSPRVNRARLILADLASFLFCTFFAWKSWSLLHEAWIDGQTSSSTWAPPLSIPYGLMAVGMTLLAAQLLLQLAQAVATGPAAAGRRQPKVGIGSEPTPVGLGPPMRSETASPR